jgi:hypothetical protein
MRNKNKKRLWPWIIGSVLLLLGVWQFLSNTYKEEEKELSTQIRKTVKEMFPGKAAAFFRTFGLFLFEKDRDLPHRNDPWTG